MSALEALRLESEVEGDDMVAGEAVACTIADCRSQWRARRLQMSRLFTPEHEQKTLCRSGLCSSVSPRWRRQLDMNVTVVGGQAWESADRFTAFSPTHVKVPAYVVALVLEQCQVGLDTHNVTQPKRLPKMVSFFQGSGSYGYLHAHYLVCTRSSASVSRLFCSLTL